jgi:hypothetical protein
MTTDRDTFNKALRVFQEFGPQRRIPRDERLRAEFPSFQESDIHELIEQFRKVEDDALTIAEHVKDGVISQPAGLERLKALHPILSQELAASSFSQAMYFTHK